MQGLDKLELNEPIYNAIINIDGGEWYQNILTYHVMQLTKDTQESLIKERFTSKCIDPSCNHKNCKRPISFKWCLQ